MPVAVNPDTGEVVYQDDKGQWQPAKTAVNPQTKEALAFDGKDWKPLPEKYHAPVTDSMLGKFLEPFTSYPGTESRMAREAVEQMGHGVEQLKSGQPWEMAKGAGNVALGAVGYPAAPINAAIHTLVGKPVEENTGIPSQYTDFAASLALPIPGAGASRAGRVIESASEVPKAAILDVPLSEGQATQNLAKIQREQAALRGRSGARPQEQAQKFVDQQTEALTQARDKISRSLDVGGQRIAESPQEAGQVVSQDVRSMAEATKKGVDAAYKTARETPGEIHAGAFEGMGQKIKGSLTNARDPVVVDETTPVASKMLQYVDGQVSNLKITNRADPYGAPNAERITGVSLNGVDQWRKNLVALRKNAQPGTPDYRAASAVLRSFDNQIDQAINGGLFSGDQRAIKAWNDARAAHADYRSTFKGGKDDPVGRVVEKIIGKDSKGPAIANDVADYMYGAAGTNPASLNVSVTTRIKKIVGENSPAWAATRQGLFERLTNAGEGMTALGPGQVSQRINKFLNNDGKEMANVLFSPAQRDMLQKYADLMRQLEIPKSGANWSNTGTFAAEAYKPTMGNRMLTAVGGHIGSAVSLLVGGALGHMVGAPLGAAEAGGFASAKIAGYSAEAREARVIAKQMPIIEKTYKDYSQAVTAAESSPMPRNIARLTLAARNLANNLDTIGIKINPAGLLGTIQGSEPASAEQKKQ